MKKKSWIIEAAFYIFVQMRIVSEKIFPISVMISDCECNVSQGKGRSLCARLVKPLISRSDYIFFCHSAS